MKLRHLLPLAGVLLFTACDRSPSEAQRLAGERAALEREKAALAGEKAAAQQTANETERRRLEGERATLEREQAHMEHEAQIRVQAERDAKIAAEREQRMAADRRAAEEVATRKAAEERARQAQADVAEARAEQTVDFFYDALDPYGDWLELERYGHVFRPKVARDQRWRPYTDGAWVHTEYGWTWRSEEPFGWATYHYGRWTRLPRHGWVWVPGTEWGPAWVSWRRSDDYVGWAPLPPDAWSSSGFNAGVDAYFNIGPGLYTFLRVADFGERTYVGRAVEPEQNVTIINRTVNVTNVVYQTVQNRVSVVNRGPDVTVINQRARQPVPEMSLQRVARGGAQPAGGKVLQLVAPELKHAPPAATPKVVKDKAKAAEMDRGWSAAPELQKQFRATTTAEASQAEAAQRAAKPAAPRPIIQPAPPAAAPAPEALKPLATPVRTKPVPKPTAATPKRATPPATKAIASPPAKRVPPTAPPPAAKATPEPVAPLAATPTPEPRKAGEPKKKKKD